MAHKKSQSRQLAEDASKDLESRANPLQNALDEILHGANRRAEKPLAKAFTEPLQEPLRNPLLEPFDKPLTEPLTNPLPEALEEPFEKALAKPSDKPSDKPLPKPISKGSTLDATHKASEQRVYSILYRETITKEKPYTWTSVPQLCKDTGIRGENTIRIAVAGLEAKKSIHVIERRWGIRGGLKIKVFSVKDIFEARRVAGIEIDERTKDVIPLDKALEEPLPEALGKTFDKPSKKQGNKGSKTEGHDINTKNNLPVPQSSSVPVDDDKLPRVRKLFEQLSGGGTWKDERDLKAYEQIAHVNLFHITLGLCYSVTKSPEHKMSSLAYAVPSILKHAEDMDEFSQTTLEEIAYRTKRKVLNCIQEGKWTVEDWDK